ncbi:MAG: glycoside hydrolase family 3 C-terminal domain-containing protein [Prevotella sp.]|nr:glycoside hydrolase family 3 C-terminal domain-containing protein [Prevotella sp.]
MNKKVIYAALMFVLTMSSGNASAQQFPYQNPSLSAHERAVDLCGRLTLEEKASLMLDDSPAIPRLGIKRFQWWSEALHGVANMGDVTVFPEPIGMAASFNDGMVYRVFDATSDEMRAKWNELQQKGGDVTRFHALSVWTPNVNIFRDPRWGRGQETYGEDPYLTSRMGCAVVRGLQGPEDTKYRKLWACAKHYAIHSGPEWARHTDNITDVTPRDLWETYMPAFKSLVQDAKVREVMCAYQRWDDEPCCGSTKLLQQILRDEWGFKYMVVSDCGAIADFFTTHKSSSTPQHAAAKGVIAGTDVECGFGYAYAKLPEAVAKGLITEEEIDKHVVRLLEGRFELGEMDAHEECEWSKISPSILSCKEHRQLSLEMARQSIVLLKNEELLPLSKKQKIAVIGPNADNIPMMWGNYNGTPNSTVTILDGIRAKAGKKNVTYLKGCDLTEECVVNSFLTQCKADGKKGIRGTFWNNTTRSGKPVTTEYYVNPIAVTTSGQHTFANGVRMEDFSAMYETTFVPEKSCKAVIRMQYTGAFSLKVNGKTLAADSTWRDQPMRFELDVEKGKTYDVELAYHTVKTWGANMKLNIGEELPIDYNETIEKLKGIETVVFVGGISSQLEGEEMPVKIDGFKGGDRTHIELPKVQREFIRHLAEAGKKIVFVNCSGSAIALAPEAERCAAIVQVWYPGMEGGTAVADVLFGDYNPQGKLPVTFYKSSSQLPDFEDYSMKGRTYRYFSDPLYAFGYGLSYTTFKNENIKIEKQPAGDSSLFTLHSSLKNTGKREGTEVVQVYVRRCDDADGPLKTLKAFERVTLKPGETKKVEIKLDEEAFTLFDPDTNTMRVVPGKYEVFVGSSSRPEDLKKLNIILN